jgi:hypothetical protein
MEQLYANTSVSISELKKNPSAIIHNAEGFAVAVLAIMHGNTLCSLMINMGKFFPELIEKPRR